MSVWRMGCALLAGALAAGAQLRVEGLWSAREVAAFTQREITWRAENLPEIESQRAVASVDSGAREYVSALGRHLAATAREPLAFPCRFVLYDGRMGLDVPWFGRVRHSVLVNALPGGIVLVPVRLFEAASDESEFAAAVARGVAHVARRSVMRHSRQRNMFGPIPPHSPHGDTPPFARTLIFTRSMEREADEEAASILAAAGFDPAALVRVLKSADMSFDTSAERVAHVAGVVAAMPARGYRRGSSPEFESCKARLSPTRFAYRR